MGRVKMNAKHEYEFVANYKLLQNVFKAKKLDKAGTSTPWLSLSNYLPSAHPRRETYKMQDAVRI